MKLTHEQKAIIKSNENIKINAIAGSGKTTTLIEYAKNKPQKAKILYLAFNKSVEIEAKQKFSQHELSNVEVKTAHSIAFRAVVPPRRYQIKDVGYRPHDIKEILKLTSGKGILNSDMILANHIGKYTAAFCNHATKKVSDFNYLSTLTDSSAKEFVQDFHEELLLNTRMFLKKMNDRQIPITHDFYLKLYQLTNPVLNYDYIFFDEGQDASPVMLDIFLKQKAVKIIVGDANQQIYSWRYAINALKNVSFKDYPLTESFRLNKENAHLAKLVLNWKKHLEKNFEVPNIKGEGNHKEVKTKAVIARTNLALLKRAISLVKDIPQIQNIYFEGNLSNYTYAQGSSLYDVLYLYLEKKEKIRSELVKSMKDFIQLKVYAKESDDMELSMLIDIVEEFGPEIFSILKKLRDIHVDDDKKHDADVIFSTVHKAKGMEYDEVSLENDFITESTIRKMTDKDDEASQKKKLDTNQLLEEINLLYVAATRCKYRLHLPEKLSKELNLKGTYSNSSFFNHNEYDQEWLDNFDEDMAAFRKKMGLSES